VKSFFFLLFFACFALHAVAQEDTDSSVKVAPRADTAVRRSPVTKPAAPVNRTPAQSAPSQARPVQPGTVNTSKATVNSPGTARQADSVRAGQEMRSTDTSRVSAQVQIPEKPRVPYMEIIKDHPYFKFHAKANYRLSFRQRDPVKEGLFYLLTALVFYFAIVRLLFRKYLKNLFAVFFRVSLKQKQIREQLLQSPLPSLLLNIFFIISGGIYVSFLLRYYRFEVANNFWALVAFSILALGIIYLGKFMLLKVMGWIFNISEATDTYNFVVFLVNKLLGIFLVPFIVLIAYSSKALVDVLVTLSFTMIAILFAYRYIISYSPVRKEIKVSQFHFFLYLCAFEIAPLLLIYKLLLTFLERST
jgi:hypothetical protein